MLILNVPHPTNSNHNGGDLQFGPDGYLYIGTGDGGGGGDTANNAQNKNVLLGKILRIDPNGGSPYVNPATNPFFGATPGADQIWAYGVRNPWRFSFDHATGDLWIADVGQGAREEVDFQAAGAAGGQNYGWNCYEGLQTYPGTDCPISGQIAPIFDYDHNSPPGGQGGCAITGGYVYRGTKYPAMQGNYIFSDYCSAVFYTSKSNGGGGWDTTYQTQFSGNITTFGEDIDGEVYVVTQGGDIFHIVADPLTLTAPVRDSGKVVATTGWQTVNFTTSFSAIPQVIAQVSSNNGTDKVYVNVRNVTLTGFDTEIQEDTKTGYDGLHMPEEVSWYAVQGSNNSGERAGTVALNHNWRTIFFANTYVGLPKILATIQTENGADIAYVKVKNLTTTSVDLKLEEAPGNDGIHTMENVAFDAFETNSASLNSGNSTVNSNWQSVVFGTPFSQAPSFVADLRSNNDTQLATIDIRNVTNTGFEFRIEEDPHVFDGGHGNESVSWAAFAYTAPVRQSGTVGLSGDWKDVPVAFPFNGTPKVFGNVTTRNGPDMVLLNVRTVGPDKFQARLEEDLHAGYDGVHTTETVNWLAMTAPGGGEQLKQISQGSSGAGDWHSILFDSAFSGTPKVFAVANSKNGPDTFVLDIRNVITTGFEVRLEENPVPQIPFAPYDSAHTTETIAYLAFETPSVGQTGSDSSVNQNLKSENFAPAFGSVPKVLAQLNTDNDPQTALVNVRTLTTASFQTRVEEDAHTYDGVHGNETVVWYAFP